MKVGYARVSTIHQNLDSQIEALKNAGCIDIFEEKKSGTTKDGRVELENALKFVRKGDTLIVTRLDRFARSMKDLSDMIHHLKEKGVDFICTEQNLDTSSSEGRLMLNMLGAFAEFETELRAERQADGIKSAQNKGVVFGRKKKFDDEKCKEAISMKDNQGMKNEDIATHFNIGLRTLQTYLKDYKDKQK
jgi:DNA invertase Pin-like site-specific DNA recombinase